MGDSLVVRGKPAEYNGLTEIGSPGYSYNFNDNNPIQPVVITAAQVNEEYEGMLVQINNVTYDKPGRVIPEENATYTVTDNTGSVVIYINTSSRLIRKSFPSTASNLVGVVSEYSGTYQILPRELSDLNVTTAVHDIVQPKAMITVYPNPVQNILHFSDVSGLLSIQLFSMQGSLIMNTSVPGNSIDVSTLTPGVYLLRMESLYGEHVFVKFSKQ